MFTDPGLNYAELVDNLKENLHLFMSTQATEKKRNLYIHDFHSCHKVTTDVDGVKEMYKDVPVARIEELLKSHDVEETVEILIGEVPRSDDDDSELPVIDLTVSTQGFRVPKFVKSLHMYIIGLSVSL